MGEIQIEGRHSDYGPDAGGYFVLRIDGVWIGRIDTKEGREKVEQHAAALAAVRSLQFECPLCGQKFAFHTQKQVDMLQEHFRLGHAAGGKPEC